MTAQRAELRDLTARGTWISLSCGGCPPLRILPPTQAGLDIFAWLLREPSLTMETETPTGTNSDYRKRARSVSVSSSDSSMSGDMDSLPSSPRPFSAPAAKYHRAPSPERIHLCTLAPTCSQPDTAQSFSSQTELDAHQASFHRWICHVPIRDKPGRIGEGDAVLFVPEQFAGRSPAGRTRERWRECGKVFPEERLLDLVRVHRP